MLLVGPPFYVCSPPSGGRFWYRVLTLRQVAAAAEHGEHFSRPHIFLEGGG